MDIKNLKHMKEGEVRAGYVKKGKTIRKTKNIKGEEKPDILEQNLNDIKNKFFEDIVLMKESISDLDKRINSLENKANKFEGSRIYKFFKFLRAL